MHNIFAACLCFMGACVGSSTHPSDEAGGEPELIIVSAAASTTDAVTAILDGWNETHEQVAKGTFASSSALARQIEAGAPVSIYISANNKWMDYLEPKDLIAPGSRTVLLTNELVLVAPEGAPEDEDDVLHNPKKFIERLDGRRLSLGDPAHVPAGIYAKQALESLGLWESLHKKMAPGMDVRAAMMLVERKETTLGIVYATDALQSKKIKVIRTFPPNSHAPIEYPIAIVRSQESDAVQALFDYFSSPEAKKIWTEFGFLVK